MWICTKIKHWIIIYTTSSGSQVESMLISQQCEWHFWEIGCKLVDNMNWQFSRIGWNCLILKSYFISSSNPFWGAGACPIKIQHQVTMIVLVWTIHGHTTGFDYHREASSGPLEEAGKNMVDEDRMIQIREKMNVCVLGNIRSVNNQGNLVVFTCVNPGHGWTHNTFLVTS